MTQVPLGQLMLICVHAWDCKPVWIKSSVMSHMLLILQNQRKYCRFSFSSHSCYVHNGLIFQFVLKKKNTKKPPTSAFTWNLLNAQSRWSEAALFTWRTSGAWAAAYAQIGLSEPFQNCSPLWTSPRHYILFTKGQRDYSRLMHFIWTLHLCKPSHSSQQSSIEAALPNLQPDGFLTQDRVENYRLSCESDLCSRPPTPPTLSSRFPLASLRGCRGWWWWEVIFPLSSGW